MFEASDLGRLLEQEKPRESKPQIGGVWLWTKEVFELEGSLGIEESSDGVHEGEIVKPLNVLPYRFSSFLDR